MKLAKNFAAATLLVFAFSLTSFAGDQQTPGYVPPPPPSMTATSSTEDCAVNCETAETSAVEAETSESLWFEALTTLLSIY